MIGSRYSLWLLFACSLPLSAALADESPRSRVIVLTDITVKVPAEKDIPRGVEAAHIILEVKDDGVPALYSYRRMILHIK